jgi:hypothetical protein
MKLQTYTIGPPTFFKIKKEESLRHTKRRRGRQDPLGLLSRQHRPDHYTCPTPILEQGPILMRYANGRSIPKHSQFFLGTGSTPHMPQPESNALQQTLMTYFLLRNHQADIVSLGAGVWSRQP